MIAEFMYETVHMEIWMFDACFSWQQLICRPGQTWWTWNVWTANVLATFASQKEKVMDPTTSTDAGLFNKTLRKGLMKISWHMRQRPLRAVYKSGTGTLGCMCGDLWLEDVKRGPWGHQVWDEGTLDIKYRDVGTSINIAKIGGKMWRLFLRENLLFMVNIRFHRPEPRWTPCDVYTKYFLALTIVIRVGVDFLCRVIFLCVRIRKIYARK